MSTIDEHLGRDVKLNNSYGFEGVLITDEGDAKTWTVDVSVIAAGMTTVIRYEHVPIHYHCDSEEHHAGEDASSPFTVGAEVVVLYEGRAPLYIAGFVDQRPECAIWEDWIDRSDWALDTMERIMQREAGQAESSTYPAMVSPEMRDGTHVLEVTDKIWLADGDHLGKALTEPTVPAGDCYLDRKPSIFTSRSFPVEMTEYELSQIGDWETDQYTVKVDHYDPEELSVPAERCARYFADSITPPPDCCDLFCGWVVGTWGKDVWAECPEHDPPYPTLDGPVHFEVQAFDKFTWKYQRSLAEGQHLQAGQWMHFWVMVGNVTDNLFSDDYRMIGRESTELFRSYQRTLFPHENPDGVQTYNNPNELWCIRRGFDYVPDPRFLQVRFDGEIVYTAKFGDRTGFLYDLNGNLEAKQGAADWIQVSIEVTKEVSKVQIGIGIQAWGDGMPFPIAVTACNAQTAGPGIAYPESDTVRSYMQLPAKECDGYEEYEGSRACYYPDPCNYFTETCVCEHPLGIGCPSNHCTTLPVFYSYGLPVDIRGTPATSFCFFSGVVTRFYVSPIEVSSSATPTVPKPTLEFSCAEPYSYGGETKYLAHPLPCVKGTVAKADGTPIHGVDLGGFPESTTSSLSGTYRGDVPWGWSGTVIPTLIGWTFEPALRTYTDVRDVQLGEDFVGTVTP